MTKKKWLIFNTNSSYVCNWLTYIHFLYAKWSPYNCWPLLVQSVNNHFLHTFSSNVSDWPVDLILSSYSPQLTLIAEQVAEGYSCTRMPGLISHGSTHVRQFVYLISGRYAGWKEYIYSLTRTHMGISQHMFACICNMLMHSAHKRQSRQLSCGMRNGNRESSRYPYLIEFFSFSKMITVIASLCPHVIYTY